MTPRPRNRRNNALPVNLYSVNGGKSFRYKHPVTGKFHGMGADKGKAIAAAKQLNSLLIIDNDLTGKVLGYVNIADHIEWMRKNIIPDRDYSPATVSLNETRYRTLIKEFCDKPMTEITTKDVADLLEDMTPRVSNQTRQVAMDVFNIAISRGLCADNPAEYTLKKKQNKQRQRLTLEQYQAIYSEAPNWLKNAMDLAYLTLQRRQDIADLKFNDIKDGYLYIVQTKTQKHDTGYLKIKISDPLNEVIKRCQDRTISPFIVHRKPSRILKREGMEHWTQIKPEMISRQFKALTDSLNVFSRIPRAQRPTFHEIRALGIKRIKDMGGNPQKLAGHASEEMTKNYDSGHDDIRWVDVQSPLGLP